jgi:hypothetical protein
MNTLLKSAFSWLVAGVGLIAAVSTAYSDTFPASLAGSYQAQLIVAPNFTTPVGSVSIKVASTGLTTGTVVLPNRKTYSFKTTLEGDGGDGVKTNIIVVKGPRPIGPQPLQFTSLRLESDGTITAGLLSTMTGVTGLFSAANTLKIATFTASNPPEWAGTYTMGMLPTDGSTETTPAGASFATLAVSPNGNLVTKVTLGDGTKFTANAKPTADAEYRIYVPVYTAGGHFSALVDLDDLAEQDTAVWNKPANDKDTKYKAGFSAVLGLTVREWAKLGAVKVPAGFTSSKNFSVDFSGDGLSESDFSTTLPDTARFTGAGKVQAVAGGANAPAENDSKEWNKLWSVTVNPLTGAFSGTQVLKTTVGSTTTSKKIKVAGVLLSDGAVGEDEIFGLGQYAVTPVGSTETTGLLSFSGPLEDNISVATAGTYTVKLLQFVSGTGKPTHAPADGSVAKFTISEDLKKITFNGVTLPQAGDSRPVSLSYSNAAQSPMKNVTVIVYLNFAGQIQGIAVTYFQFVFKMPLPESRTVTFQNFTPGTAGFTKLN